MHPNHIIFIFWHLNELWFGLDLQAFLWCGGEQNFQHPSLVSINILVPPHRVGPNCHLYQVMQTAPWMILKWEDAVCTSFGSFSADIGHDIFITHCSPFSGLTSSVLTDTFCGKKIHIWVSCVFHIWVLARPEHVEKSPLFFLYTCVRMSQDLWSLFFWKKLI